MISESDYNNDDTIFDLDQPNVVAQNGVNT